MTGGASPFYFYIYQNPQMLTIQNWYKQQISSSPDYNAATAGILTPVTVGHYSGYKRDAFGGDSTVRIYYLANKDKIYQFNYSDYPLDTNPDNIWIKRMYEQIIRSINFTN